MLPPWVLLLWVVAISADRSFALDPTVSALRQLRAELIRVGQDVGRVVDRAGERNNMMVDMLEVSTMSTEKKWRKYGGK